MISLARKSAVFAAAAAMLLASAAFCQKSKELRVRIPFAFSAAGKEFPAGEYQFSRGKADRTIIISDAAGKGSASMNVITSLARSRAEDDHLLAFDKVGDKRILSEVWIPEQEGDLVFASPGSHEHEVVRLQRNTAAPRK